MSSERGVVWGTGPVLMQEQGWVDQKEIGRPLCCA
jgi:hypothetical protein